ncbi:MAG: hypothetical protein ACXAC7_15105 [Candidatus Hodarchaeales archaeon]|jgi:hypothetical protein
MVIKKWNFLIGKWKTDVVDKNHTEMEISHYPSDLYLYLKAVNYKNGKIESEGFNVLFFYPSKKIFYLKTIFAWGFVVNYISNFYSDNEIQFESESINAVPRDYEGSRYKYLLKKINNNCFEIRLDMSMGGDFAPFWSGTFKRIE